MIENFTPQPYPLWAVWDDEDGGDATLGCVLGWRPSGDGFGNAGLEPVVARLDQGGYAFGYPVKGSTLFDDRAAAEERLAMVQLARRGRTARPDIADRPAQKTGGPRGEPMRPSPAAGPMEPPRRGA
jgi:hypothetical protein